MKIGVESSLTNVIEALKNKGYEVVTITSEEDVNGCDYCVITGQDENVMGVSSAVVEGSVIDARGYSAEDIVQQLESKLH